MSTYSYNIEVFGQSFTIASDKSEQDVQAIAASVDKRMRERARASKTIMPLRIAIMTALEIAEECFDALPAKKPWRQDT